MKTDFFQCYGLCWVFQICWHIKYSTLRASSFRIRNSSAGIPLPPLALFVGEGDGTPLQYSCLENPMDRGAWEAAVHGVVKSQTQLSNLTFTFHFHALEKEMATHSSILAGRIPGMGELGGLPSMGSHRVGHNWSDLAAAAAFSFTNLNITAQFFIPKVSDERYADYLIKYLWVHLMCSSLSFNVHIHVFIQILEGSGHYIFKYSFFSPSGVPMIYMLIHLMVFHRSHMLWSFL